jgi:hypothetical protein
MSTPVDRRTVLLGLAAGLAVPAIGFAAEIPVGSIRVIVELLAYRQAGTPPLPLPLPPLPNLSTITGRVEPLGRDTLQMSAAREAIATRGGLHVLAHSAWAAIIPPNGRTTAQMEDVLPADSPLAGGIAVQRSQYLFMFVDVDYTAAGATYGIRMKRRIKFGERHYFDHPAFGLIVQVRPTKDTPATE